MKGDSRNFGFFIAFIQLLMIYRQDTFLFGIFPIICLLFAVKSVIKMNRDLEQISDEVIRKKISVTEKFCCGVIILSAYFLTAKVSIVASVLVVAVETLLYISFISPKYLNRKYY